MKMLWPICKVKNIPFSFSCILYKMKKCSQYIICIECRQREPSIFHIFLSTALLFSRFGIIVIIKKTVLFQWRIQSIVQNYAEYKERGEDLEFLRLIATM